MNARDIAAVLGDARREGRAWRCRCPLHRGRSLVLRDGDGDRVLVTCWAGCDRLDVLAELRSLGLLSKRADYALRVVSPPRHRDDASRIAYAMSIWKDSRDGADTIVPHYLASRSIVLNRWPPSLRFHPGCPRPKDHAGNLLPPLPAMVALIEHVEHGPVAVHCTYLRQDGSGKANIEKPKAMFGPVAGAAVRFGLPRSGAELAVAEGIETALSVAVSCSIPAWAALSAGGIKNLVLSPEANRVLIVADHDARGTGDRRAHDATARWLAEGRRVRVTKPHEVGTDFNDVLTGCAPAKLNETRHGPA
jgi:putative DNA primase/helicase